jgi:hypothetical protein
MQGLSRALCFCMLIIVTSYAKAQSNAPSYFSDLAKKLQIEFEHAHSATQEDALTQWACYMDAMENNQLVPAVDYGFTFQGGKLILNDFGLSGKKPHVLVHNSDALVASDATAQAITYLAIRASGAKNSRRLLIEESSDFQLWQEEGKKSQVTGLTPNLYVTCNPLPPNA